MKRENNFILTENPYLKMVYKIVAGAFILGGFIVRLETKMDSISDRLIKKIDEHIIRDEYEKQIIKASFQADLLVLTQNINNINEEIASIKNKEFILPETIRRKKNNEGFENEKN